MNRHGNKQQRSRLERRLRRLLLRRGEVSRRHQTRQQARLHSKKAHSTNIRHHLLFARNGRVFVRQSFGALGDRDAKCHAKHHLRFHRQLDALGSVDDGAQHSVQRGENAARELAVRPVSLPGAAFCSGEKNDVREKHFFRFRKRFFFAFLVF